jgi:hypothetical protein
VGSLAVYGEEEVTLTVDDDFGELGESLDPRYRVRTVSH